MKKCNFGESAVFNPRLIFVFALCSAGVLLAMFSLAATTPPERTRANSSVPPDPANSLSTSTFGGNANHLPPGVPLPPGAQFSGQGDPTSSSPTAEFPGFAGMPLRPGTPSDANPLANPVFANQQPAPASGQQPAASESMPLASEAQSDWSIVNSPNTPTQTTNVLLGVTCVLASDCWAVGYYNAGSSVWQTLIERWDGTSWTIVSSPNASTTRGNFLYGVTCVSASDCWAVGHYINANGTWQTLIERWDGTSWAIVTSPNTSATLTNDLTGVTCVSPSDCWAVGYAANASSYNTLIERWDGTSWAIVTSPSPGIGQSNFLYGVTCVSASDCWAVGYIYTNPGITLLTLIERWDGVLWTIVSSPNASAVRYNQLFGVTCVSASDCLAVGYYNDNSPVNAGPNQTLIERWDGTSWAIVTSPNTSATQYNDLRAVTCVSASDCWAVGHSFDGIASQTLIERWDGASWAIVSSPNPSPLITHGNFLYGVTCVSAAADCWAVGYYDYYVNATSWGKTLVLRYTASPPPIPTSVVSRKTHDTAGDFDIDLPLAGNPGIECRTGGTNNDYQMLVTFANAVTFNSAAVTSGTGSVSSTTGSGTPELTVNLTGVTNAQTIMVSLSGVNDGTATGDVGVQMTILAGDTTADQSVNSSDIAQTKSKSGQTVTSANFRQDVTINGVINSSDIALVKSKSGTALP